VSDVTPLSDPVPVLLERGGHSPFDKSVAAGLSAWNISREKLSRKSVESSVWK